ncbi:MAG: glutamate synthase subunit beta [Lentisphaeria bacterium]|jgi:glutamate synthase (NADPH/NADH) small chain
MGKPTGFKEFQRETPKPRAVQDRVRDYREIYHAMPEEKIRQQAARCMNCGVPFCHSGCPLGNVIPDWNDLVYRGRWDEALQRLHETNNFPEFTGRLCPAPCEEACVLGINECPTAIRLLEQSIVEQAFEAGKVTPRPPAARTGKKVAVIGAGPAGLACAQQLNRAGHGVAVYERAEKPGGLLRFGIPDFKLEKWVIDRRTKLMEQEGIEFRCGQDPAQAPECLKAYDATVLCVGATKPRDLPIPGRDLAGVHFAMDFLTRQNRVLTMDATGRPDLKPITATDKHVIVIGGGDTGADCVGTALRQGAKSVTSFELLPMPPEGRPESQPWPYWPMKLRTNASHYEGGERFWSILTKEFRGGDGKLRELLTVNGEFVPDPKGGPRPLLREIPGSEHLWRADLVLLALGFLGPEPDGIVAKLGLALDRLGNIQTDADYMTATPGIFAAGDARRGQSLVVWAISEGREAARGVDAWLRNAPSALRSKGNSDLPRV